MPQIYVSGLSKVLFFYTQSTNRLSLDAYACVCACVVVEERAVCVVVFVYLLTFGSAFYLCFLIENNLNIFLAIFRLAFYARCFSTPV